ncbi:MAG TPA: hypothetical protein VJ044_15850, partial [Candidatus Hodarchaeales archaeon]|nr:hypothetical protein [Candidatus Hodarchaeales archaeon]
ACPQGALYYGNLNEDAVSNTHEVLQLSDVLEKRGAYRFKEEENTRPSVFYLPPSERKKTSPDLKVDVSDGGSKEGHKVISVQATEKAGAPLQGREIIVKRLTTFGDLVLAKGRTDADGRFSTEVTSSKENSKRIIIQLVETQQYMKLEVSKDV